MVGWENNSNNMDGLMTVNKTVKIGVKYICSTPLGLRCCYALIRRFALQPTVIQVISFQDIDTTFL